MKIGKIATNSTTNKPYVRPDQAELGKEYKVKYIGFADKQAFNGTNKDGTPYTIEAHREWYFESLDYIFVISDKTPNRDKFDFIVIQTFSELHLIAKQYKEGFFWAVKELEKEFVKPVNQDFYNEHLRESFLTTLISGREPAMFLDKQLCRNEAGEIIRDQNKLELFFRVNDNHSIIFRKVISTKQVNFLKFEIGKQYVVYIKNLKNQKTGAYYLGIEIKPAVYNSDKLNALLEELNKEPTTDVEVDNLCKELEGSSN